MMHINNNNAVALKYNRTQEDSSQSADMPSICTVSVARFGNSVSLSSPHWRPLRQLSRRSPYTYPYFRHLCLIICFCSLLPGFVYAQDSSAKASDKTITTDQLNTKVLAPVFRLNQFGYVSEQSKRVVFVMPIPTRVTGKEEGHKTAPTGTDLNEQKRSRINAQDSFFVYRLPVGTSREMKEEDALPKTMKLVLASPLKGNPVRLNEWFSDRVYYVLDLKGITIPGDYKIKLIKDHIAYTSPAFKVVSRSDYVRTGVLALLHYFRRQRANTPVEWTADAHLKLKGSDRRVDLRGGWCDASGDVSKYFSHLAYTNFMSPQQIPLVTWSLIQATEKMGKELSTWGVLDSIRSESLWGADYLLRSLSDSGYFYMTVFSYFKKDPTYREIVGLEANSVTTTDYACAMREGAGMAIAALARISNWKRNGAFSATDYLEGAKRAYHHLMTFNASYDDDGVANIIDDYCGLMAATELWHATNLPFYQKEARRWASHLCARYMPGGYLRADGQVDAGKIIRSKGAGPRPFWHATDAGLPVVSLIRYLDFEKEEAYRDKTTKVLRALLKGQLALNRAVDNPFDYPRQAFLFKGKLQSGFFIPHENESGWWWQGENARLASLATAALSGRHFLHTNPADSDDLKSLSQAATDHLSWITGCNPYGICFLYGFGSKNVPYMHSNYGHGSETGGISNGITGLHADGTGIAFRTEDKGNEWRWTEQWLPHAAWYLQALTAMEAEK